MRFDPKIVRTPAEPDVDDEGELMLPPDLALLAEQLREDADHLARAYPGAVELADSSADDAPRRSAAREPVRWQFIAGAALVLLLAVIASRMTPANRSPVASRVAPPPAAAAPHAGIADLARRDQPRALQTEAASASPAPDSDEGQPGETILWNISGPELEGVLDLLEHEAPDHVSLSI